MKPNLLNSVSVKKLPENRFDLSYDVKLSLNMGELVPMFIMDCIPGDRVTLGNETLLRFAPMVSPVMHGFHCTVHYFFVPLRLLWDNFERYITQDDVGGGLPVFPNFQVSSDGSNYTRLMDYLHVPMPTQCVGNAHEHISVLPFSAYQLIFNEYYRDQNLVAEVDYAAHDGDNTTGSTRFTTLRKRAWSHDYLTAALPFAQKGDAVDLPLGDVQLNPDTSTGPVQFRKQSDHLSNPGAITADVLTGSMRASGLNEVGVIDPQGSLIVGATTVTDFRRAIRLQEFLELQARGGTRYIEQIKAQFGVHSSDKRLQRPEYITGMRTPVKIAEVLNTTGTDDLPQGNMAGHGLAYAGGRPGSYFCEEHGYIMGIMSVMPETAYQQGMPKHFSKINDPLEFFWSSFENIGEQEIQNREVMAFSTAGDVPFGYIPRYAEYKFNNSKVAGDFRTSLNYWHAGRIFTPGVDQALNQTFIECDATHRIFAVTDPSVQKLYVHTNNMVSAVRKMSKFGNPYL